MRWLKLWFGLPSLCFLQLPALLRSSTSAMLHCTRTVLHALDRIKLQQVVIKRALLHLWLVEMRKALSSLPVCFSPFTVSEGINTTSHGPYSFNKTTALSHPFIFSCGTVGKFWAAPLTPKQVSHYVNLAHLKESEIWSSSLENASSLFNEVALLPVKEMTWVVATFKYPLTSMLKKRGRWEEWFKKDDTQMGRNWNLHLTFISWLFDVVIFFLWFLSEVCDPIVDRILGWYCEAGCRLSFVKGSCVV